MLPLEFIATPEASPRCMSGGSLMKFGTESNCSSGADVDCANADGLSSTKSPVSHGLMRASLATVMRWTCWLFRRCASIQMVALARQSAKQRYRERNLLRAFAALALLLVAADARADGVADFYRGKQVNIVVGYGSGGGYDVYARLVARHFGRHIPGNPSVVVQNMPGAGSLRSVNYIYNTAPKDGTAIATFGRDMPLIGVIGHNPNVRFDARKLTWLGSSSSYANDAYMLWVRKDAPVQSIADARRADGPPLILGGTAEGSTSNDVPILLRDALGLNIRLISGYPDGTALFIAVDRKEVDGRVVGIS